MRTKHILTALVLPALFVACTADDFNESFSNGAQQRAALRSDLVFNFGGADTRFNAGDPNAAVKFAYEEGDQIGGAIIDQYSISGGEPTFTVVDYVSTNHPFVRNASGEWTIKHTMVEGHYLFYYPYNENNHERGAVKYSIPVLQDLSDRKTGKFNPKAAIERYNMGVGAQFLAKEDLSAGVELVNLYSYARVKVTIDNHFPGGNVDKIVLQAASGSSFALNGQISNKEVSDLFTDEDFAEALAEKTTTADFCLASNDQSGFYAPSLNETSPVVVAKFPANTALAVDAQNNKSIEAYMVLPAAEYSNLTVYLYMADGKVYDGTIAKLEAGRNKIKAVEVTATASTTAPYVVTSEADWNNYAALIKKNDKTAEFIIAGDNFSLSNNAKYPTAEGAEVTVKGNLKVSGNNVTMNSIKAETITVLKGAKLNITDKFTAGEVVNEGTVVIKKVLDKEDDVVTIDVVKKITNKSGATLNIEKDAEAAFELDNAKGATVENNGTMTITGTNDGIINNIGTMKTTGFTVNEPTTNGDVISNMPTINNDGEILAISGTLTNKATIINNGEITCNNSTAKGEITNNTLGIIDSKKDKITYITTNEGLMTVYEANPGTDIKIGAQSGVVEYTTTNATENFEGSIVTKVIASKDLSITKKGNVSAVIMNKGGKLTLPNDAASLAYLYVGAGNVTLGSNLDVTALTIVKNASITIPGDMTLFVKGKMSNKGSILVSGTFKTVMANDADGAGTVKADGPNASVVWGYSADAHATYLQKLPAVVKAFINGSNYYKNDGKIAAADFDTVLKDADTEGRKELKDAMKEAGITTVPQADLNNAVADIVKDNKTAFTAALKAATYTDQTKLYDTKDGATEEKPISAYGKFREDILKIASATMVSGLSGDKTLFIPAATMTTAEIDAILATKAPNMFIWKDCDLDKLVALWKAYDGNIGITVDGKEFSDATADDAKNKAQILVGWVRIILNTDTGQTPAMKEVQEALSTLGVKASNVSTFAGYSDEQMNAIDNELLIP